MTILREYQRLAVQAVWDSLSPDVNRVAVEMGTGLGKTITFAAAIDEWLTRNGPRVLVLVHTDELVKQAVDKIGFVTRGRWTIGVVKAGRNEADTDIVVASVQTLASLGRREQITDVGFIVVDECHHGVAGTYLAILDHYGAFPDTDPSPIAFRDDKPRPRSWRSFGIPVLGVTATLARSDGQGLGQVWQDVAFTRSLTWGIRHGYLIDLVPYTIKVPTLDLSSDAALDAMLADSIAPEAVVKAWMTKTRGHDLECDGYPCSCRSVGDMDSPSGHPSTVLFAPLVKSAEAFATAFNEAGVKAEVIHGKLSESERTAILDRYEAGITTVLCNAMVLTEGWDSPRTMCVIVARPTKSVPLFVQMVGRGLRPWHSAGAPGQEDQRCVLLCLSDGTKELATVADLSDNRGDVTEGKSFLAMADEWDLGADIEAEDRAYRGPVVVERWDAAVQASSKAWKYTKGGAPFLPIAKRGQGYIYIVDRPDGWAVCARNHYAAGRYRTQVIAMAPDLELAMALAEDEAQERGGDVGRLLADKNRAWRKAVPSAEMLEYAGKLGINVVPIMQSKSAGKAGRLSDLIDQVVASRTLDRIVTKIRERASNG